MLRFRTILHPTDFSKPSNDAFGLAKAFAEHHGARLVVLHVVAPPVIACAEGIMLPVEPKDYKDQLMAQLRQSYPEEPKIDLERRLAEGDPPTEILRVAEETSCDLIVLGTHGRKGISRLLLGSVAEQVLRRAPCPVVTVKAPLSQAPAVAEAVVSEASQLEVIEK